MLNQTETDFILAHSLPKDVVGNYYPEENKIIISLHTYASKRLSDNPVIYLNIERTANYLSEIIKEMRYTLAELLEQKAKELRENFGD